MNEDALITKIDFINYFNAFKKESSKLAHQLEMNHGLASPKGLTSLVTNFIIEDIDLLLQIKTGNYPQRHTDGIIRNLCEQVIELIYVIQRAPELLDEYLGQTINELEIESIKDPIKGLLKFGKARFTNSREAVCKMARDINEYKDNKRKLSLYTIFSIKSEQVHNSYFKSIIEEIGRFENDLEDSEYDIDYMYLVYIIEAYSKSVLKI